jgi:hypothetical protein
MIDRGGAVLSLTHHFFAPFAGPWRTLRFKIPDRKVREEKPQSSQSR